MSLAAVICQAQEALPAQGARCVCCVAGGWSLYCCPQVSCRIPVTRDSLKSLECVHAITAHWHSPQLASGVCPRRPLPPLLCLLSGVTVVIEPPWLHAAGRVPRVYCIIAPSLAELAWSFFCPLPVPPSPQSDLTTSPPRSRRPSSPCIAPLSNQFRHCHHGRRRTPGQQRGASLCSAQSACLGSLSRLRAADSLDFIDSPPSLSTPRVCRVGSRRKECQCLTFKLPSPRAQAPPRNRESTMSPRQGRLSSAAGPSPAGTPPPSSSISTMH